MTGLVVLCCVVLCCAVSWWVFWRNVVRMWGMHMSHVMARHKPITLLGFHRNLIEFYDASKILYYIKYKNSTKTLKRSNICYFQKCQIQRIAKSWEMRHLAVCPRPTIIWHEVVWDMISANQRAFPPIPSVVQYFSLQVQYIRASIIIRIECFVPVELLVGGINKQRGNELSIIDESVLFWAISAIFFDHEDRRRSFTM